VPPILGPSHDVRNNRNNQIIAAPKMPGELSWRTFARGISGAPVGARRAGELDFLHTGRSDYRGHGPAPTAAISTFFQPRSKAEKVDSMMLLLGHPLPKARARMSKRQKHKGRTPEHRPPQDFGRQRDGGSKNASTRK